jgi:periplasmic protein TonB
MRGPFFMSLGLHVLACVIMIWASQASQAKKSALPQATVVHLVRPATPPAPLAGTVNPVKEGNPPESEPPLKIPKKDSKKPAKSKSVEEPVKAQPKPVNVQPSSSQKVGGGGKELRGEAGTLRVQGSGFEYDFYLSLIQSKIEQNFRPPPGVRAASLSTVGFSIQKNGLITNVTLTKSSGNLLIDQAALRAIRAAGQFPPLPAQYAQGQLDINFEFVINPTAGR